MFKWTTKFPRLLMSKNWWNPKLWWRFISTSSPLQKLHQPKTARQQHWSHVQLSVAVKQWQYTLMHLNKSSEIQTNRVIPILPDYEGLLPISEVACSDAQKLLIRHFASLRHIGIFLHIYRTVVFLKWYLCNLLVLKMSVEYSIKNERV